VVPVVPVGPVAPPAPGAPPAPPPAPHLDLFALGTAAVFAVSPAALVAQRQTTLATLRTRLGAAPATRALEAKVEKHHIVIALPPTLFGGADAPELTPDGKAAVRALAALLRDHGLEIRADPDRALELATVLVVAGVDPDRLALAATDAAAGSGSAAGADGSADSASARVELVVMEGM
jgi:hypothetical protein